MKTITRIMLVMMLTMSVWISCNLLYSPTDDSVLVPHITYEDLNKETRLQIDCLAENIYFEARGESDPGKAAVAFTTLNRTHDREFPNTICKVVKQRTDRTCQFSWVCDKSINTNNKDVILYRKCRDIAVFVYVNSDMWIKDNTNGATYYHADSIQPNWKHLHRITVIGHHIFYRS